VAGVRVGCDKNIPMLVRSSLTLILLLIQGRNKDGFPAAMAFGALNTRGSHTILMVSYSAAVRKGYPDTEF
jgi:hypothetical protein